MSEKFLDLLVRNTLEIWIFTDTDNKNRSGKRYVATHFEIAYRFFIPNGAIVCIVFSFL